MKNKTGKVFVILLIAMVVLACSPFGLQYVFRGQGTATPTPELPIPEPQVTETQTTNVVAPNVVDLNDTLVALYEKVSPGVVSIQFSTTEGEGLGSGFVVDKQGHIVTNYHVVQDVDSLEVHFASGE
ncbi:MAG: serine protease, partial [Thermotogaceae bacterium]|nr:serine protease [Thermotogaceae bacterium]